MHSILSDKKKENVHCLRANIDAWIFSGSCRFFAPFCSEIKLQHRGELTAVKDAFLFDVNKVVPSTENHVSQTDVGISAKSAIVNGRRGVDREGRREQGLKMKRD